MKNKAFQLWYDNLIMLWDSKSQDIKKMQLTQTTQIKNRNSVLSKTQETLKQLTNENLMIIGDNYWGLLVLQNSHAKKFKLAYLDPPYNTGTGEKAFRDSFDHTNWLTFMKNRMELIFPLLCDDGVFFLHLNKIELGYAQILCDYIFGRENFLSIITWERSQRTLLGQGQTAINDTSEYILLYAKNKRELKLNRIQRLIPITKKTFQQYNKTLFLNRASTSLVKILDEDSKRPIHIHEYPDAIMNTYSLANFLERQAEIKEYYQKNYDNMIRLSNQQKESTLQQRIIETFPSNNKIYSATYIPDRGKHAGIQITKYYLGSDVILFLKDVTLFKNNQLYKLEDMNNFWGHPEIPVTGIAKEGRVLLKRGKKPESLLKRIFSIGTDPGDWILDPFGGSGTSCAVAQKMNRQWVTMDLPTSSNLMIERINNVMHGKDQDQKSYSGSYSILQLEELSNLS